MNPDRRPFIAGNWKMNVGGPEAAELATAVALGVRDHERVDVLVAPPFTALAAVRSALDSTESRVALGAQNMSDASDGAFTGEVSSQMLLATGVTWVLLGHSERRQMYGETDSTVEKKTQRAMTTGPRPMVCVGETLAEREAGTTLDVVERQVRAVITSLARQPGFGAIAYEPVWAIGTGRVASPEDAEAVHAAIRALLATESSDLARATRILYGGSVKADNAAHLLGQPNVDGALVGGASLEASGFAAIVAAAQRAAR